MANKETQYQSATKNGSAAAAIASATVGIITLAISNVFASLSQSTKSFMLDIGKLWIPGAEGIGPYSGKETFMVAAWLSSWILLYFALRNKEVRLLYYSVFFMAGVGVSTLLVWTPVVHLLR